MPQNLAPFIFALQLLRSFHIVRQAIRKGVIVRRVSRLTLERFGVLGLFMENRAKIPFCQLRDEARVAQVSFIEKY